MDYDLIIRNGAVATTDGSFEADIGVRGGVIVALAQGLAGTAAEEVDAAGMLVLPGGVDTHTHIDQPPEGAVRQCDDFAAATTSAAAGGTTTVVCFAWQLPGTSLAAEVAAYHQRAAAARVDYAFHLTITDPTDTVLRDELPALIAAGNSSIKIFMTYAGSRLSDAQVLEVLEAARANGALVCVHAEDDALIGHLTRRLIAEGKVSPKYFPQSKPILGEAEAIRRIATYAELLDVPVHIFHVSGAEAAAEVERAQRRGVRLSAETCPQYLTFTAADLDRPGFEGAKLMFGPPPRSPQDHEALWRALRRGVLSVISSDHAPMRFDDPQGKKVAGEGAPFDRVPNGVPGIATRMRLIFSEGVAKGRIGIGEFVALTATRPAKLFGLYPRKGAIAIGSDADLVLWDPAHRGILTHAELWDANDYSPYEGMEVTGKPMITWLRGRRVHAGGRPVGGPGGGRFLARGIMRP